MGLILLEKSADNQDWLPTKYRIASGATTAIFQVYLVTQLTAGTIGRHTVSWYCTYSWRLQWLFIH